jgi:hydrogenase maturation protein HypF
MSAFHIHFQGQVQGVGFRPFVYKKAIEFRLAGRVNNSNTGVHIEVEGDSDIIHDFYNTILNNPPELAIITKSEIKEIKTKGFKEFEIVHSENTELPNLLLTPDYGICNDCLNELFNPQNRRYHYPFITCTNCGPRYSIIKKLPYDRENTTMDNFRMCAVCEPEYHNPLNRRYYSQTNSCADCAVEMRVLNSDIKYTQSVIIELIQTSLRDGKIIAIKGIGGYLLLADATNIQTINILRKRKHRPAKPFALMYPNEQMLWNDVEVSDKEKEAYNSIQAPIILFRLKDKPVSALKINLIAPGLYQIGVMKAYTPLYHLILAELDFPVIATSANVSESPIIYQDDKAAMELNQIADLIIANNREIIVPQDDSVMRFSPVFKHKIIIRRSRSLSPTFIDPHKNLQSMQTLLGMGAGLKSSFAFYTQKNTYISQYLGNLNSFESQESFEKVLNHFFTLFETKPEIIVADKHPQYFSTQLGQNLSGKFHSKIYYVQHHRAHFASVLAENGLININKKILGMIWDGVGLGDDGNIWGGEFFIYDKKIMKRIAYFEYFTHIALDKFAMEPRLPAFSVCNNIREAQHIIKQKFSDFEYKNYQRLTEHGKTIKTSSVGRLFDAVASLLNIKDKNTFEGEAAMLLENIAMNFYRKNKNYPLFYDIEFINDRISTSYLAKQIIRDILNKVEKSEVAFKFHLSFIEIIKLVAQKYKIKDLAFSGGVFQNALLVDLIHQYLKGDYHLYFHKQLSPNDENISFGQLVYVNSQTDNI